MSGRSIVAHTWPNDHKIMQNPQMLHKKNLPVSNQANDIKHGSNDCLADNNSGRSKEIYLD